MAGKWVDIIEDIDKGINMEQLVKKGEQTNEQGNSGSNEEENRKA